MIPHPFPHRNEGILFDHAGSGFVSWIVLPGALELFILAQAGGGGGGAGFSRAAATAGGGGGGGGSGGKSLLRVPVLFLPPVLYVRVGAGGLSGTIGGFTNVAIRPNPANESHQLIRASAGSPGGNGTAAALGAAGAAGAVIPQASNMSVGQAGVS